MISLNIHFQKNLSKYNSKWVKMFEKWPGYLIQDMQSISADMCGTLWFHIWTK